MKMGWARVILKGLKAAWRSLLALGSLVGILYLWPDVRGLEEVYPFLEGAMPSRETLLIVFAIGCVLYVGWIDLRPLVLRRVGQVPEAIVPRELTFVITRGDEIALSDKRAPTLSPCIRLKNTTQSAWHLSIAEWSLELDRAKPSVDATPVLSPRILAGEDESIHFPAVPWRGRAADRNGKFAFVLLFWHSGGPQFAVDAEYAFELNDYGAELGREQTQIIEKVRQSRTVSYRRVRRKEDTS